MDLGYFAINDKKKAVLLNEEALKFTRNDAEYVRWYCKGAAENGDLVLYMGKRAGECIRPEQVQQMIPIDEAWRIVVFQYENSDSFPMIKQLEDTSTFFEGQTLLHTAFSEEPLCIELKAKKTLRFALGSQEYRRPFSEIGDGILLLFRRGRIRFFSKPNSDAQQVKKVLRGESFAGYMEGGTYHSPEDLFESNILNAIESLRTMLPNTPAFCTVNGRAAAVSRLFADTQIRDEKLSVYAVGDEKDYLEFIKEKTKTHDRLFRSDEIKIGRNELSCEARLRGNGENIAEINRNLEKVCRKNVTIVLTGESGTGKTFLAKEIHKNSRRADGPFINVNCAAIAYNLIESELFGYEDGAFTGAKKGGKIGYFEMAKGGTLFLDEISELPLLLQGKLLEVLQDGTFYRVGGVKKISTDVRLIVATNRNLEQMVKEGKFREDLYYRISVFPIKLPPLRERIADLYSIIEDTLPLICSRLEVEPMILTDDALQKMKQYRWPGNIRELENVLEKAAVISEGNFIHAEDIKLDNSIAGSPIAKSLKEKMKLYEKELIQTAFEQFSGNRRLVAEYLGISKTNLFEKVHQYGIDEEPEERNI